MSPLHKSCALIAALLLAVLAAMAPVQAQAQQPPPSRVVVAPSSLGAVTPVSQFIGTVYFNEVSQVATETPGQVESYSFQTGDTVRQGQVLVRLNTDLLSQDIRSKDALYKQGQALLEEAQVEFDRMQRLIKSGSISQQEYDQKKFQFESLKLKAASLAAELERLRIELAKAELRAPFNGVVLARLVNRGEWVSQGEAVAELARNDVLDVLVDVPQQILDFLPLGREVEVRVAGKPVNGKVTALVPKGDVATRTFPLKIQVKNPGWLAQGMEAAVELPNGPDEQSVVVPRDAVVNAYGTLAVYAVVEGQAQMIPVETLGYKGMSVGVRGKGLEPGMSIVIKGNERLRPGQPVAAEPAGGAAEQPEKPEPSGNAPEGAAPGNS